LGLGTPTEPRALAIPPIIKGDNVLLVAPTASGKTEAALLPVLSRHLTRTFRKGIAVPYVTPLRALNRDILGRLAHITTRLGVRCEVPHGDTSASQRRKQSRNPPEILITTPETLQAILPSAGDLPDFPKCSQCGSGLLAFKNKVRADVPRILQKWKAREQLTDDERRSLRQGGQQIWSFRTDDRPY